MPAQRLHIILNAHLDPVWLWRWPDGYSEAHNTVQAAVALLEEYPDLKFSRSSACVYHWIEESNPALFERVRRLVAAGRFEPVGGWWVQSDTIIASGESLVRQAEVGKTYFRERFGVDVRVAYSADSFGQNVGLPKILTHSGFDYYVFQRPGPGECALPDLFWWESDDGSRILTLRNLGYNTPATMSRDAFVKRLEATFERDRAEQWCFVGVGDHGGGPTRTQIEWLHELQQTRNIVFSTVQEYFDLIKDWDLPTVRGELTHHAPGCYTTHSDVKRWVSSCGRALQKAEAAQVATGVGVSADTAELDDAWREYLFAHFHDIFPGSSVREVYEDTRDALGGAMHAANRVRVRELHRLAKQVDTREMPEGGVFAFNPLPWQRRAVLTLDAFQDPNAIGTAFSMLRSQDGTQVPLVWDRPPVAFGPCGEPWGRMTAVVDLPPMGYRTLAFARGDLGSVPEVDALPLHDWLKRLHFDIIDDQYDTWGHGASNLGPVAATLHPGEGRADMTNAVFARVLAECQCAGADIRLALTRFSGIEPIQLDLCVDWQRPGDTLKLCLATGLSDVRAISGQAYALIERAPEEHEQPMQEWVGCTDGQRAVAVVSDSTHAYDCSPADTLRLTLLRAVRYADHTPFPPRDDQPFMDLGVRRFRFWLVERDDGVELSRWLPRLATAMRTGADTIAESNHAGHRPWCGSGLSVEPDCIVVGAVRPVDDGVELRLCNLSGAAEIARVRLPVEEQARDVPLAAGELRLVRMALRPRAVRQSHERQ